MKLPLKELQKLRAKHKFSDEEWKNRHVNPSDASTNQRMNNLVNHCIDELIEANELNKEEAANIIEKHFDIALNSWFDTEERDFLHSAYFELSRIIGVTQFVDEFKSTYYFLQQNKHYNPEIHKGHTTTDCQKCGLTLEIIILETEFGLKQKDDLLHITHKEEYYDIVTCKSCQELNIPDYNGLR